MPANPRTILKLEVPLIVRVAAREMHIRDLVALAPGAILELNKSAEDELDVMINNRRVGSGVAVKIGENFGIRVTGIGSAADRIKAAAGG